jgi:hypothetical protein
VSQSLDATTAFQDPVPVFNAPTQAVPTQTLLGLLRGGDLAGRQQEPLNGLGIERRRRLEDVHHAQREGLLVRALGRREELDFAPAQLDVRRALLVPDARLLLALLRARALAGHRDLELTLHGTVSN